MLASAALAQQAPPDPSVILDSLNKQLAPAAGAWLNSSDPRMQAWGAYLAVRDRRTEAVPDLLRIAAAYPATIQGASPLDIDRHDAMLGVLDALIQLGAQTPVADAQRIYAEFPVQSLILLSRSKEDITPALLPVFKSEQRWTAAWLAAGNLLLNRNAKGFAAALIEGMVVHARVMVTEPGVGSGGGGGSTCCGAGLAQNAKSGWPPLGVYGFGGCGENSQADEIVLAAGPDAAYYRRQVSTTYQIQDASGCGCNFDRDLARQHYFTKLLFGSADHPPVSAQVSHTIIWQGPDVYGSELTAFIGAQQQVFTELAQHLGQQGLLSGEEARTLRPKLEIKVWDQRALQQAALPAVAGLAENVTVEPF